jgi:hypothetical protein
MRTTLTILAMSFLLSACGQEAARSPLQQYDRAILDMKYQAVESLSQDLSCTEASSCACIGIGSKPCGGPWRYLVYSKATVDEKELKALVADLKAYEEGYNKQEGIISDCSITQTANPGCTENKCVDLNAQP